MKKSIQGRVPPPSKRRRTRRANPLALVVLVVVIAAAAVAAVALTGGFPPSGKDGTPTPKPTAAGPTLAPTEGVNPDATPTEEPSPTASPTPTPATYPTPDFSKDLSAPEDFFGPLPSVTDPKKAEHFKVHALYVGGGANMATNLALVQSSEDLDTVVVDLKESNGVYFKTTNKLALEIGAMTKGAFDLKAFVANCHAKNVRVIGRLVIFKDPVLASARPDLCLQDIAGNPLLFSNESGKPFVSPYKQEVWDYNIALAAEAVSYGVDEIQFDYVRFPTGPTKSGASIHIGPEGKFPTRPQAINRFLTKARIEITDRLGVPLGADVFGIILSSKSDGARIGQDWATIGVLPGIDNLCPMIYPSHYANSKDNGKGTFLNGILFPKPDLKPYDVMYNALLLAKPAAMQEGYSAVRPYLQAFTASWLPSGYYMSYGAAEIAAQIKAIRDAGFDEYICWNSKAVYPAAAFQ